MTDHDPIISVLVATLERALVDYVNVMEYPRRDTERWLCSTVDHPFAFKRVCQALDLIPGAVLTEFKRKRLLKHFPSVTTLKEFLEERFGAILEDDLSVQHDDQEVAEQLELVLFGLDKR